MHFDSWRGTVEKYKGIERDRDRETKKLRQTDRHTETETARNKMITTILEKKKNPSTQRINTQGS